jgi:hypothetical protein
MPKGLLIAAVIGLAATAANAGTIWVYNYSTESINIDLLELRNIPGAVEGYGTYDSDDLPSPYTNALRIYTAVDGISLSLDARPVDTLGWDFYLGVQGAVINPIDNSLWFQVRDATDLSGKTLLAWDYADPTTIYSIPMDGAICEIVLSDLANQGEGEYAHWRLEVVPEPATMSLLALGGVALLKKRRIR